MSFRPFMLSFILLTSCAVSIDRQLRDAFPINSCEEMAYLESFNENQKIEGCLEKNRIYLQQEYENILRSYPEFQESFNAEVCVGEFGIVEDVRVDTPPSDRSRLQEHVISYLYYIAFPELDDSKCFDITFRFTGAPNS